MTHRFYASVLLFLAGFCVFPGRSAATDDKEKQPTTRPVISEEVAPLEAIAPIAKDGNKGEAFLRKPPGDGPFPAVVLVHGGLAKQSTAELKDHALGTWTSRFLAAGYVVADTTYRSRDVDPQTRDSLEDVLATIEHVRKLPYVDAKSIVVTGSSGGGDLALSVAAETDIAIMVIEEPASMIFMGMFNKNVPKQGERYTAQDGARHFGDDYKPFYTPECQKLTRDKIAKFRCPILLIQGDHPVKKLNEGILLAELKAADKTVEVFNYKGEPHSFAFLSAPLRFKPGRSPHPNVARKAFEDVDGYLRKQLKTMPVPIDPKLVKQVPIETK
ncbi:MAG TPA: dienelactone hydrolase family protein [Gemmataceae bacterium]|nr:dienelactone hydrolase family protein [Gemmataceae bacterium]